MSESFSKYADMTDLELRAESTVFHMERDVLQAQAPTDLRRAYDRNPGLLLPMASTPALIQKYVETIVAKLCQLGLDMDDTSDERIAGLENGMAAVYDPGNNPDKPRKHTVDHVETTFMSAYYRTLSAIDVTYDSRLRLVPQSELVQADLHPLMAATVLRFTAGDAYTQPHPQPRKAFRRVKDADSPYWGHAVGTDTFTGTFSSFMGGPNVYITVPTGVMTDASVVAHPSSAYMDSDVWRPTTEAGYVPSTMMVQRICRGTVKHPQEQVDTRSGHVAAFLRATGSM